MIYIQQGLTASRMKEVQSPYSDFETLISVKTIEVKAEDISTEIELPNGQTTSRAKGELSYYFLAGELKDCKRSNATVLSRSLVVIDYDALPVNYEQAKSQIQTNFSEYSHFIYPTISHTEKETRMRLVVDCDRNMNKPEYEATLNHIVEMIGLPFDRSSLTYSQMMALPTTFNKQAFERLKVVNEGKPFKVIEAQEQPQKKSAFVADYSDIGLADGKGRVVQLLEEVMDGIQEGGRNHFFAQAFGILLKANMDVNKAIKLCFDWNTHYTDEPLTQRELEGVLKSILQRELNKKGGI